MHVDTLRSYALIAILFRGSLVQRPELNDLYTHLTGHPSLNHALRFVAGVRHVAGYAAWKVPGQCFAIRACRLARVRFRGLIGLRH